MYYLGEICGYEIWFHQQYHYRIEPTERKMVAVPILLRAIDLLSYAARV